MNYPSFFNAITLDSKWAIDCLIWKKINFSNFQHPASEAANKFENESFPNKTIYNWSVEATDFKNVILNKIHWAASEAAEV